MFPRLIRPTTLSWRSAVMLIAVSVPGVPGRAVGQIPEPHQYRTLQKFDPAYELPEGVLVDADVVYSRRGERALRTDVFRPTRSDGPAPAVVFIQGSGYNGNNKVHFWREAAYLAQRGYVCLTIEHRGLNTEGAQWPSQLEDASSAIAWLEDNAERYGVDNGRIGVVGASSGAHLAGLIALADSVAGIRMPNVRVAVLISGLLDVVYFAENPTWSSDYGMWIDLEPLFGSPFASDPETWLSASPLTHVSADDPPILFVHGTADASLPSSQTVRVYDRLRSVGGEAELMLVEGGGHEMTNSFAYSDVLTSMLRFLDRYLR